MEKICFLVSIVSVLLIYFNDSCKAHRVCSWTSSSDVSPNTVTVVHVNCTEGKVMWKRPKGALLVEIAPPFDSLEMHSWRLCIRPKTKLNDVLVSYLENGAPKPFIRSKTTTDGVFCTTTNGPSLTLYIELKPGGSKIYGTRASFYYAVVKNNFQTPTIIATDQQSLQQCQPCQTKYLLESFCDADLVFKGVLSSNGNYFIRFTIEKFVRKPITDDGEVFMTQKGVAKTQALIQTPDDCVLPNKVESTEFLVVAKMHLGRAQMVCAPLWSDWLNIRHRTLVSSNATLTPCDVT